MRKLIMTTVIAACIALCAAVWPQSNPANETPAATVAQPTAESEVAQKVDHEPAPETILEPDNEQTVVDQQSNDMVYVPGFGWIESQGPNQVEYAEDMYENSNKIGSMG